MSLSPEVVNQSVFLAALFLTLISVPKLCALTVWNVYKELLFLNLSKLMKPLQVFTKEGMAEPLTKGAEDPSFRQDLMMKTLDDFRKDIRDPLLEASTAAVILYFLIPLLPSISTCVVITLIVIVVAVIGAFVLTVVLWRKGNRILRMKYEEAKIPQPSHS